MTKRVDTVALNLALAALQSDLVLMDLRVPELDGLEGRKQITADRMLNDTRVLVLTTLALHEYVFGALRAGAGGFLLKGGEPGELFSAIRLVAAGESLLAPSVTKRLIDAYTSPNPNNCRSPLPESPDRQDPRIPHPHEAPRARSRSASRDRLPSRPRLALEQRIRRIYRARRR